MTAKPFEIYIVESGEVVGELQSGKVAHRIVHLFLDEWPEVSPLTVRDRIRRTRGSSRSTIETCPKVFDAGEDVVVQGYDLDGETRRQLHLPAGEAAVRLPRQQHPGHRFASGPGPRVLDAARRLAGSA